MPLLEELQAQENQQEETPSYGASSESLDEGRKNLSSILSNISQSVQYQPQDNTQGNITSPADYGNISSAMSKMGSITTPYGGNTRFEGFHPGVDIANKIGTPIESFSPGVVTQVESGHKQGDKAFGNYIIVTDPQGNQHRYSHLSQSFVRVGDPITQGEDIAAMGNTGNTYSTSGGTGSHLDYRIKDAAGRYLNPYSYLSNFYNQKYGR